MLLVAAAFAQSPVLPPVLLAQAELRYPPEAGAEVGDVVVMVTVGVDGTVLDGAVQSGPEVFHAAALEAARSLRFTPATRDGRPVEVRLPASFHFAPPPPPEPAPDRPYLDVVVEAHRDPTAGETHAVSVLAAETLERAAGEDLASTLEAVPGVISGRSAADGGKPIIRGQTERRLLILYDGVRHESQKWGLDHATEIDPFAAGSIHVVRGAAGVRYGPDAIGGVILVEPPPPRLDRGLGGQGWLFGNWNGWRGGAAARLDVAPIDDLGFRLEGDYSRGASLSAPDYVLANTGSEQWDLGAALSGRPAFGEIHLAWRHYDLRAGVCTCAKSASPDELAALLDAEQPVGASGWTSSYDIGRAWQDVSHDLALAGARVDFGRGHLDLRYAFQLNRRLEYDHARASISGPQYDFTLRTHSLDLHAEQEGLRLGRARLGLELGADGSFQENVYSGMPLIPNFRSFQAGVSAFARVDLPGAALELGARYDHLGRDAWLTPSAFDRALARDQLQESDCARGEAAARCPAAWDTGSVSLGGRWSPLPDQLELRVDLSSASRFPDADELYMNGAAPSSPVYALGDPGLGVETTWGGSPTVGLRLPWMEAELSPYLHYIHDHVYFAPEMEEGGVAVDVTIQGAFPRYTFRPVDALFYGLDGSLTLGPEAPLRLGLVGMLVRGQEAASGEGLVLVPPDRVEARLGVHPTRLGPLLEPYVEVSGRHVFAQTHVDPDADLAPPPDAYFLLGAGLGLRVAIGDRSLSVGLEGANLLDQRYRDYSSLLHYFADEPGRDLRLRLGFEI